MGGFLMGGMGGGGGLSPMGGGGMGGGGHSSMGAGMVGGGMGTFFSRCTYTIYCV